MVSVFRCNEALKLERLVAFLIEHNLAAGDWQCLAGFVGLFHQIVDGPDYVLSVAAPVHGNLRLVESLYVCNGLCSRNLAGTEILYEKSLLWI